MRLNVHYRRPTKAVFFSLPVVVCGLTALVLAVLTLGPFMHETDQGWLLDGGLSIARGHPEIARSEFNFDKQFVSYYLAACLCAVLPRPLRADTLVWAGNFLGLVFFWGLLGWLLACSARRLLLPLVLPVILAPALLVHSPFYASAFISAALVFLLAAFLERKQWRWWQHGVVFLLAFSAVGARADAMFLLPLLAMLHSPRRTFVSVVRSPNTWLMAVGGWLAFFLGRLLYLTTAFDFARVPFNLKQVGAYLVFGLGGAGWVMLLALHAVWCARAAGRSRVWQVFLGLGLALPMGYYSLQLLSPRHCVVGVVSILVFICARSGRLLFQLYFRSRTWERVVSVLLVISALLPVLVGVDLAYLSSPRLTLAHPTLLPTPAGVSPTGAYLAYLVQLRRQHGFVDHNQAVFSAATQTVFQPDASGQVPILDTPVESYLILAIHLQGKTLKRYSISGGQWPPELYVDSRTLLRFPYDWRYVFKRPEIFFSVTSLVPATDANWHGITILCGDTRQAVRPGSWTTCLWVLNQVFGGDEFRLEQPGALASIPSDWAGKKLVLASSRKFTVTTGQEVKTLMIATTQGEGQWQTCEIGPLRGGEMIAVHGPAPAELAVGVSVFPEWLSVRKLPLESSK
jgi:hypothetical protein